MCLPKTCDVYGNICIPKTCNISDIYVCMACGETDMAYLFLSNYTHSYLFVSFQVDVKRSVEDGEKRFNQLSIEERGKFDEETLVNVNNIRKQSKTSQRAGGFSNEYIVVRFLLWNYN